jgi:hypothetical protein
LAHSGKQTARPNHEVTARAGHSAPVVRARLVSQFSPRPHRDQVVAAPWGLAVILRVPVPLSLSLPRLQLGPSVGTAPRMSRSDQLPPPPRPWRRRAGRGGPPPPPAIAAACRAWRNPKPRPQEIKPPSTRGNPHPVQSCAVPPLLLLHKFLRRCIQLGSKPVAAAALVRGCHTHPLASVIGQGASLGRGGPVGGGDWSVGIPDGARISHRGPADAQPRGRATIVANPR